MYLLSSVKFDRFCATMSTDLLLDLHLRFICSVRFYRIVYFVHRYIRYCEKYWNMLISHGIKPILVFDGQNLPAKADTEKERREYVSPFPYPHVLCEFCCTPHSLNCNFLYKGALAAFDNGAKLIAMRRCIVSLTYGTTETGKS